MKVIRKATSKDIIRIEQVVGQAGLQTSGIVENVDNFLIMEEDENDSIIAVVGFEYFNENGLLRSLVVAGQTNQMTIIQLMGTVMEYSKKSGLKKLYLCTNHHTTVDLFEILGFKVEQNLPVDIEKFEHFQNIYNEQPIIMQCTF